jgi:hypothetical protein
MSNKRLFRTNNFSCLLLLLSIAVAAGTARAQKTCFGSDAGAASPDYQLHYNWAAKQDLDHLKSGIKSKLEAIYKCPGLTDNELFSFYAALSLRVAEYVPDASWFKGDRGIVDGNWQVHYDWARKKGNTIALSMLISKITTAFDCLDRKKQVEFYAELSHYIAWEDPSNEF